MNNVYDVFRAGRHQAGLTLLELMVAIAIGAILMTGLVSMFSASSNSRRALEKTSELIENGRYAATLLYDDLRHAGFYGHTSDLDDPPAALPDPCEIADPDVVQEALTFPVQGYRAANLGSYPDVSATTCDDKNLLINANMQPGSDVLVIRRADTGMLAGTSADGGDVTVGTPATGRVYLQSNARGVDVQIGNAGAGSIDPTDASAKTADNAAQSLEKFPSKADDTWADIRQLRVHVYFVAPCSFGTGTDGICQGGDDNVPTLKRLELTDDGSGATEMAIVPLVEGVEYMKVEYGIDNTPAAENPTTGFIGDGIPDTYPDPGAIAAGDWPSVVVTRVHLLVRTADEDFDHTDIKSYSLGTSTAVTAGPFNDNFRRRVFTTDVRPVNLAGRREIPQ